MAIPIVMPKLGMVMVEGTLTQWMKSHGEPVEQGEVVAEIETEKISYELEATAAGTLHTVADEGANVEVDGVLGYLLAEGESPPEPQTVTPTPEVRAPEAAEAPASAAPRPAGEPVPSTPGARRLARELGLDIAEVPASGPRGRIVEADVRVFAERRAEQPATQVRPAVVAEPSETVAMDGMRKAVAGHMLHSVTSTAQLTFFLELDVTEAQRERREASAAADVSIGLAHVFMKACAEALARFPRVNTVLLNNEILYFDGVNIGFAVALGEGLIVPVVHDVQDKTVAHIAAEMREMAAKAREGRLDADEMSGGTFTISVLGTVDGFTPILNPGQNALLGVGRTVQKPVVRKGKIVVREMCTVSLTVDHQVIDGAVAASFLRRLQQTIERPGGLF